MFVQVVPSAEICHCYVTFGSDGETLISPASDIEATFSGVSSTALLAAFKPLSVAAKSGGDSNGENTVIVVAAVAEVGNLLVPSKESTAMFSVSDPTKLVVGV